MLFRIDRATNTLEPRTHKTNNNNFNGFHKLRFCGLFEINRFLRLVAFDNTEKLE